MTYSPRREITAEQACNTRAHALRYALDRYFEKQKSAEADGGEDGAKGGFKNGSQVRWNIQQP